MIFLPIVERELRVAARRRATYWMRFFLALLMVLICFFVLAVERASNVQRGLVLFNFIGILALIFCLAAGIFLTADCLSEEKRDGTLGLLFLTELKGYDVTLGKLMGTSLHAFYGLLAILPVLALPLLLGGVTPGEFARVTLVLIASMLLSLSVGMLVSALSRDARQAMTATLLVLVFLAGLLPAFWWLQRLLLKSVPSGILLWASPAWLYARAFARRFGSSQGLQQFWGSLSTVLFLSGGAMLLAGLYLPRGWREKGEDAGAPQQVGWRRRLRFGTAEFCRGRRRWLEENPFYWLATRDRLSRLLAWGILWPLFFLWICFLAGALSNSALTRARCFGFAMVVAFATHLLLKCLVAFEASRRLNDDRRSGALELMLVTPLSGEQILEGQLRALRQLFHGPFVLALLINAGLFCLIIEPNLLHLGPEEGALLGALCLGGIALLFVDFYALSWVGMRMGLRTSLHRRAILATIARVMVPSWLGVLLLLFIMGSGGFGAGMTMAANALWLSATLVLDLLLAVRARTRLLLELRPAPGSARADRA